jgi:hypothetical protein
LHDVRHFARIAAAALMLTVMFGCSPPPDVPSKNSSNSGTQKLPFDRQPRSTGNSPSQSLIPSATKLPEGAPIEVHLQSEISSLSAHAGDTFSAILDEPILVDGQPLLASGTAASGRVLEAKAASGPRDPGYLRIVLVSLDLRGRPVMIYTSSIFAKGGARDQRNPVADNAADAAHEERDKKRDKNRDVMFGTDRRLYFRVAQTVDLESGK